jgi:prophage antirepressor-like protein
MTGLAVFSHIGKDVPTVLINGQPWFVLADVCRVLGLTTPSKVAERLDIDEKGMNQIPTLGGTQVMGTVNESGLYSVILRSDKPQAKQFRRWVTSIVLPEIRQTGSYIAPAPELGIDLATIRQLNTAVSTLLEPRPMSHLPLSEPARNLVRVHSHADVHESAVREDAVEECDGSRDRWAFRVDLPNDPLDACSERIPVPTVQRYVAGRNHHGWTDEGHLSGSEVPDMPAFVSDVDKANPPALELDVVSHACRLSPTCDTIRPPYDLRTIRTPPLACRACRQHRRPRRTRWLQRTLSGGL